MISRPGLPVVDRVSGVMHHCPVPLGRGRTARPSLPLIVGILNLTPDSFSDGGAFLEPEAAVAHARQMADEGADVIDIGGESSRPDSQPVEPAEQIRRVVPVIEEIRARGVALPVSIDTRSAEVAAAALDVGADLVNDISAARDDGEMPALLTSPTLRPYVRSIVERFRPTTMVLSQNEIHPKVKIKTLGQV